MRSDKILILTAALAIASSCCQEIYKTDSLGIDVTVQENREYSYTDKKSGFWYGRTHQDEPKEWYSGWNIAKKRVLADYEISVDGKVLDRKEAECTVYPDRLVRKWGNTVETLRMIDDLPVIHIAVETDGASTSLSLDRTLIDDSHSDDEAAFFTPKEAQDMKIMLRSDGAKGFVLTYGTEDECRALYSEFISNKDRLIQERKDRINSLITEFNPVKTDLPELDKALDWITITMDELITEQQGNGI